MPNSYVNTIYNVKDRPLTSYPDQLIQYLVSRYHIKKKVSY